VRLDVSIERIIEDLPDSAEIGFAVGCSRYHWTGLTSRGRRLTPSCGCRRLPTPTGLAAGSQYD
jgi:hypothetical protein